MSRTIQVRLPDELHEKLKACADAQAETTSAQVRVALEWFYSRSVPDRVMAALQAGRPMLVSEITKTPHCAGLETPEIWDALRLLVLRGQVEKVASRKQLFRLKGVPAMPTHVELTNCSRKMDLAISIWGDLGDLTYYPDGTVGKGCDVHCGDIPTEDLIHSARWAKFVCSGSCQSDRFRLDEALEALEAASSFRQYLASTQPDYSDDWRILPMPAGTLAPVPPGYVYQHNEPAEVQRADIGVAVYWARVPHTASQLVVYCLG